MFDVWILALDFCAVIFSDFFGALVLLLYTDIYDTEGEKWFYPISLVTLGWCVMNRAATSSN